MFSLRGALMLVLARAVVLDLEVAQLLSTCTDGNRYYMFGCVARVAL